jgi:acetylornithine deacetylase
MQERIFGIIVESRQRYIDELREMVRLYPRGEERLQEAIGEKFEALGCETKSLKLLPTTVQLNREFAVQEAIDMSLRTHVVGKVSGSGAGRSLILITHPDADPIDTEGWTKEPHTGQIVDGRMYGWAVADDLAGICIMLAALDSINKVGLIPSGDLYLFSATAKRNAWGIAALLREGYTADAALYIHPAESELGLKEIKTLTSGLLKFRIRVKGKKPDKTEFVHVTFHHLGVNSIDKALYLIDSLRRLDEERRETVHYGPLNDHVGRGTNLLVTYIEAGERDNLTDVPPECVVGLGLTFPPTEDIEDVVKQVEAHLEVAVEADDWLRENPPELEWVQGTQGVEVAMDHPIVEATVNAIREVTGETPFSNPLYSKSDVRTPVLISGIPNVGFGPLAGDLATTGGVDEWVNLDDYIRSIKVCTKVILDWCGLEPTPAGL